MTADETSSALDRIESGVQALGREVLLRSLQCGLPEEAIRSLVESAGLRSVPELEALYGWRNGTSMREAETVDDIQFFPGFCLLSLEDAIANYRAFVTDERWSVGWLPVFANAGGDFYVVDLASAPPLRPPVREFLLEEVEHPVAFASITSMLSTLATAFERRVFYVDGNGYLEMDDLVFAALAQELDPGLGRWA